MAWSLKPINPVNKILSSKPSIDSRSRNKFQNSNKIKNQAISETDRFLKDKPSMWQDSDIMLVDHNLDNEYSDGNVTPEDYKEAKKYIKDRFKMPKGGNIYIR